MSKYGLKIQNIQAGTLWGYNLGVRSHFESTDAMLCNSLFLDYMRAHGLRDYKDKSTRDVICLNFQFGAPSYEEQIKKMDKKIRDAETAEEAAVYHRLKHEADEHREDYIPISKKELRTEYYTNGVTIRYANGEIIHYKMLYRNASKAKVGQVMFINAELYDVARDWLTMGLSRRLGTGKAKIVELSAYAPLTTSTIVSKFHMPVRDVLILKDQDSFFSTLAKVVKAEPYEVATDEGTETRYKCVVKDEVADVKNTLWDGMALVEADILPPDCNGMALLRNHFFKACAFKCNLQQFFHDWCAENGHDYYEYEVLDMFGLPHKLCDIQMVTTNNATKWGKFRELMYIGQQHDADLVEAYEYWCRRVEDDGSYWGVVKTDHPSKLGTVQQMSYQMVNTLPCSSEDIDFLANTSVQYVESLKRDPEVFANFLRAKSNIANHYEMMAALYEHNHEFANSSWFRYEKSKIIKTYVAKLKNGKITVNGDNLTICGNPYALLLYAVGEDWQADPTINEEPGTIQCYTTRFGDGEFLCGIRNPQNSPNNIVYLHNKHSREMEMYFPWSPNILAVNCIHTDVQSRANGADSTFGVSVQKCA